MSLEKLKQEILEEAESVIKEILEKADKEVERILTEAKRNAELIKQQRKDEILKELKEKERSALSMAKIDGRKLLLTTQEEIFEKVSDEVKNKLSKVRRDKRYLQLLIKYIKEGIRELGTNKVILGLNNKDKQFIKKYMDQITKEIERESGNVELIIGKDDFDIMGGVILYTVDGSKIFNNSFEARLNIVMDRYRNEIMNILFGE